MIEEEENYSSRQLFHKKICVEEIFKDAYIQNSVQFNIVEVTNKDNTAFITGIDFTSAKLLFAFDSEIRVVSDEHLIKLHFSLDGEYSYQPLSHIKYLLSQPYCKNFWAMNLKALLVDYKKLFQIQIHMCCGIKVSLYHLKYVVRLTK